MRRDLSTAILGFALALVALSFGGVVGCNSSDFGGTTGKAAGKQDGDDDDDDDDDQDTGKGGGDVDGEDSGDAGDLGDADDAKAGDLVSEDEAACLLKKGDNFRVLFVLDNSGSTEKTDPSNVRREAALRLVDKFTDFVTNNSKAKFSMAVVGFSQSTTVGSSRWVKLDAGNRAGIEADITLATTNPGNGTFFLQAMDATDQLLQEDGSSASEKRQRSYVIFLSDGRANGPGDSQSALVGKVNDMANNRGIAVYSILIGQGGSFGGGFFPPGFGHGDADPNSLMPALAVPSTGLVGPDHVGTYVHAPDAAAIDKAFADFFTKLTGC